MSTATRSQAAGAGAVDAPTPASPRSIGGRIAGPYNPEIHCGHKIWGTRAGITLKPGEKLRKRGDLCRQYHGFRTEHPGIGHCWLHGGLSPTGRSSAATQMVSNELRRMAMPDQVQPIESLLEAVRVASWREAGIRMMLRNRANLAGPDHLGDGREDVVSAMHARALKQKADIASLALERGLEQRLVELAEAEAAIVVRAVQAALDSVGAEGAPRAAAEAAAAEVLEASLPNGAALN